MELREVSIDDDSDWLDAMDSKLSTRCLCPKCGTQHEMKLRWTGRGAPRKFCNTCKKVLLNAQPDTYYDVHIPIKNIS